MIARVTFTAAAAAPSPGVTAVRIIAGAAAETGFTADRPTVVVVLGDDPLDAASARAKGIEIGKALTYAAAHVVLPVAPALLAWVAAGIIHGSHRPDYIGNRPDADAPPAVTDLVFETADPGAATEAWEALRPAVAEQAFARHLIDRPGNRLLPKDFAAIAQSSESLGISVGVITGSALTDAGLALLHAVGRGSANAPCLATLRWRGAPHSNSAVVLVGKGITFDTGGLCIKPAPHMETMKYDMAGAATVLATVRAAAEAKLPVNITGLLAIAENMPGSRALRPGDIIHSHSGLSVEVIDTDAEGRLILADALSWAVSHEQPEALIDLATLTGAMITALGRHTGGIYANADALADSLIAAGRAAGEPLWRMPYPDVADEEILQSDAADLRSCAPAGRLLPDARHAASFLSAFVPEDVPWAHLDIAGTASDTEGHGTGVGVLTLYSWLRSRQLY